MTKKIMFVMNQMTSGGAERVVSILANNMSDHNYNVSLVITFESDIHYFINDKVDIIKFDINKNSSQIGRNIIEIKKLISTFNEEKPDVIISFIRNVNCIIAAKIARVPIIISERNNPKYDPKSKVWRLARKLIYPLADGIVFQTEGAKSYFSKTIQNKSRIIRNPLESNMPIKNNFSESKKEIVTIGRLCNQKDQETLIRAFNEFHKIYNEYKLIIYGEGELRDQLNKLVESLDLSEFIEMPGSKRDIYEKIKDSDVFVLSSKYEGYPNSLIEAMAIGLPIISIDCEYGPDEIISNYENGILVQERDYKELAKELVKLISDSNLMERIGRNALKIRADLDKDIIVNQWIKYIFEVTKKFN